MHTRYLSLLLLLYVREGAICMELLTPDGWSQAYRMESVILQIMTTIARSTHTHTCAHSLLHTHAFTPFTLSHTPSLTPSLTPFTHSFTHSYTVCLCPDGARIIRSPTKPWTEETAHRAYAYLVRTHKKYGWHTPAKEDG